MDFSELMKRIGLLVDTYGDKVSPTDAAAIVFSHWQYSMDQAKSDLQAISANDLRGLLDSQRSLLSELKSPQENSRKQPWMR